MSATRLILAISVRGDLALDRIAAAAKDQGGEMVPFYTDEFPANGTLDFRAGYVDDLVVQSDDRRVALTEIHSIWVLRMDVGKTLPPAMNAEYAQAARKEALAAVGGAIASFDGHVLDPIHLLDAAAEKPRQLREAQRLGLRIPPTVITNNPDTVRGFAQQHGPVVAKPLRPLTVRDGDDEWGMYASLVSDRDLAELDSLRWCPLIFQAAIPKAVEIRATIVGGQVFAAEVDSQASEAGRIDWRRANEELAETWKPHTLPRDVADQLVALVRTFGLSYSAADLILTPSGEYVFLESNPAGEWGWVQEYAGLDIAGPLTQLLLSA